MTDSPLQLLLDFDAQARRDRAQSPAFLHRRDRKFALVCQEQRVPPDTRRWLSHLNRLSDRSQASTVSEPSLALWRRINRGFAGAGLLTGVLTMTGLLFYDGGQRINITVLLAFVLLHLVLAVFTTLQALAGWQPWRPLLVRFGAGGHESVFNRLHPLLMARAAHLGGLCFAVAGLLTLLTLVVVQDLAFGWSTTLDTAAARYHHLVSVIAAPWAWLWPAAAPDLALVEATRFFRAANGAASANPVLWGQWWPFVTMLWLTLVMLPRLVLWWLTAMQTRRRARRLLAAHPAMHALLYRLETPMLDTGTSHHDAGDLPDTRVYNELRPLPDSDILLCWAGAGEPELPDALAVDKRLIARAGGRASLAEDEQTLRRIASELANRPSPVTLLVRAWEPPTGELQDLLETARELWPAGTRIAIVPLATDVNRQPDEHQLQPWLRFARRAAGDVAQVSLATLQWPIPYGQGGQRS